MQCIRVHRARRAVHCAAALVALAGGTTRQASAQQPYPGHPPYPTYPAQPQPFPGYPVMPTAPGIPPMPAMPGMPGQSPVLAAYRLPVITVAQPTEGVVLPDDRPIAILRFVAGEPLDPIDALSLQVFVDGEDRTNLFTLAQHEAWGRLAPADELLAAGQHEVRARICTTRGACGIARATVTVVATTSLLQQLGAAGDATRSAQGPSRRTRVLGAVLQAMRVLIK